MVTFRNLSAPSLSVKTIAATLALIAVLFIAASVGRLEGRVEPFLANGTTTEVARKMSTIAYSKVSSGTTYTRTYTRNDGESETDFDVRAKGLWAQFCATNGI